MIKVDSKWRTEEEWWKPARYRHYVTRNYWRIQERRTTPQKRGGNLLENWLGKHWTFRIPFIPIVIKYRSPHEHIFATLSPSTYHPRFALTFTYLQYHIFNFTLTPSQQLWYQFRPHPHWSLSLRFINTLIPRLPHVAAWMSLTL